MVLISSHTKGHTFIIQSKLDPYYATNSPYYLGKRGLWFFQAQETFHVSHLHAYSVNVMHDSLGALTGRFTC